MRRNWLFLVLSSALGILPALPALAEDAAQPTLADDLRADALLIRDRLDARKGVDRNAQAAVDRMKVRALEYLRLKYPEVQTDGMWSSVHKVEGDARIIGHAYVEGWQGVDQPIRDGNRSYYKAVSPDGTLEYRIGVDRFGWRVLTAIKLNAAPGVQIAWNVYSSKPEPTVTFTRVAANGRSTTTRILELDQGTVRKASVRYGNGTSVDHQLALVVKRGGDFHTMVKPSRAK